jgi:competence protein ComEC
VVLNLAAIPLMTVVQIGAMVVIALSAVFTRAAVAAGFVVHAAAEGLVQSSSLVDLAPGLALRMAPPGGLLIAIYYGALLAGVSRTLRPRLRAAAIVVAAVAGVLAVSGLARSPARPPSPIAITFLDVGQGDAALVRLPGGRSLLVDSGGARGALDLGARVVAPALWALGLRRLDYLAVTHGDPDHGGGAAHLVADFRPREIWEGIPVPADPLLRGLVTTSTTRGAAWRQLQAGDAMRFGDVGVRVLHPALPDWERPTVRNDDSLVIEIALGDVGVLLTGDIGRAVEQALVPSIDRGRRWIVKVPHHGSLTSSSMAFVAALRPVVAIVSAGRANLYGHPRREVLDRYRAVGTEIFRTDEDGAVTVSTDGREIRVKTMTGRELRLP